MIRRLARYTTSRERLLGGVRRTGSHV
jgi:hypothetical protein